MSNALETYKNYMDNAHWNYTTKEQFEQYYNRVPKFRYDTMKYCWDQVVKYNFKKALLMVNFLVVMKMIQHTGNQKFLLYGIGLQDVLLVLLVRWFKEPI